MIRFYSHSEIDPVKWNASIEHSIFPTLFADYDLLSLVAPHWGALIKDDFDAVMPLPIKSKCGVDYIFTPFFISRLGIFSKETATPELLAEFLNAIPKNFKQCDLCLNPQNDISSLKFPFLPMTSYALQLSNSYDQLHSLFSENNRRNIKSAEKFNLEYCTRVDIQSVIDLFRNNRGSDKSIRIADDDYALFAKMVDFWNARGQVELVGVKDDQGKLLAGACFLKDHLRRWFLFSGRDNANSEKRAMFFLLNEYVKCNAEQDLILDFNGSNNPNIARFYAGFGAEKYVFPYLSVSSSKLWNGLMKLYRKLR